ncbi:MAG: tetratricopeptide repeat protein [Petrimonas sp.]|nr:tetratricopeptide repeat protein [Petrimonas sp.]
MKYNLFFLTAFLLHGFLVFSQKTDVKKLMQEYRYREAIELLQSLPENRENMLLKAVSYEKLYDYPSAVAVYEKLFATNPSDVDVVISLAEITAQSGDADASLKYWKLANELSPDNLFVLTKKAMAHYRASDWAGTLSSSTEVFKKDSIPILLRMTGDAYHNLNDDVMANYHYTKALEKNPKDYLALSRICEYYYAMKEDGYDTVIVMTENYLKNIDPQQKTIGQLNGMANYSVGNYKAATKQFELNTALGDSTYTTCYFLGMTYFATKLYYYATKWLERAYEQNDNDINLLYYYGTSLARTFDRKKGIEVLQQGVEKINKLNSMLYDFELSLADAYLRSESYAKSIDYYRSAYKRQPDPPILYNIAQAYDSMKDYKNALAYYERFLKTAPADMKIDATPVDNDELKKMPTSEVFYRAALQRIEKLKEELFFKEGKQ